jgi:hypothetical protein
MLAQMKWHQILARYSCRNLLLPHPSTQLCQAKFGKNTTEIWPGILAAAGNAFLFFGLDGDQETDKDVKKSAGLSEASQLRQKKIVNNDGPQKVFLGKQEEAPSNGA